MAQILPHSWLRTLAVAAVMLSLATPARPQVATEPPKDHEDQSELTAEGYQIGSVLLNSDLVISGHYSDNIFASESNEQDDWITLVSPSFQLRSDWDEHEVRLEGGAEIGRYSRHENEDYEDFWFGSEGRYDFSRGSNIFGGARFSRGHEERDSADDVNGVEPTTFVDIQGHLGTFQRIDRVTARVGGTMERLDFDNVQSTQGQRNNDDRDRTQYEVGGRFGYLLSSDLEPFVQGFADLRRYGAALDDNGRARDSDGLALAAGLRRRLSSQARFEILAGYLSQDYEDPTLPTVNAVDFGARLLWGAMTNTVIEGFVDRSVEETTLDQASATLDTVAGVTVEHALRPDLSVQGRALYVVSDFEGIDRSDDIYSFGAGIRYFFMPHFFVGGDYRHLILDSSEVGQDYTENQGFIRLGAQLAPAYDPATMPPRGASGFYAGVQAGLDTLTTGLNGPRGSSGSLTAGFGDSGAIGGLFGGYQVALDRWRLGLELEAGASTADWDHNRAPAGRNFSVAKGESYGLGARIGYQLPSGALVYGRVGPVVTTFETAYRRDGTVVDQDDKKTGVRFGGGLEVPLDGRLFARLDHTFTDYGSYDVDIAGDVDRFDHSESLVRLGLGYRLFEGDDEDPVKPIEIGGFYVGAQAGYGEVGSENVGPRGLDTLSADRADGGTTGGFFGGYGLSLGNLHLGLEFECDLSNARWKVNRVPTGRVYSVEKEWTYGGSVRVGYVLGRGALLYGRLGAVRTRFRTDYAIGANDIRQDDDLKGLRIGAGVEVPATDKVFLRLDYGYTGYEDYRIDYGSGIDDFDNEETMVRLGVGYRF